MNLIVRCATFSKSLNPQTIDKRISDIRIRTRFPFESSIWISLSGCKLTILPDIQPANRIVIISAEQPFQCCQRCGFPAILGLFFCGVAGVFEDLPVACFWACFN